MKRIKRESEYDMFDWWKKVFIDNYATFEGRARRSEFWYYALTNILVVLSLYIFVIIGMATEIYPLSITAGVLVFLYWIANLIPYLGVIVRRLHDTSKSGWWFLISFVPLGGIVLLVFYCLEGDRGQNEYGPDPKQSNESEINQIGRSSY